MGCTSSRRRPTGVDMERKRTDQDYPTVLATMWAQPLTATPNTLARMANDVARLACRTDVRGESNDMDLSTTTADDDAAVKNTDEGVESDHRLPALFQVALQIASLFGEEEVTAVSAAVESEVLAEKQRTASTVTHANDKGVHTVTTAKRTNPDMALVAARLLEKCGGDDSPTVRVMKMFHQRYVLETRCALQLGGPLAGMHCNDVTTKNGWRIVVERLAGTTGGLLVRHIREERLSAAVESSQGASQLPANHHGASITERPRMDSVPDARVRWEVAVEFDPLVRVLRHARCDITDVVTHDGPEYSTPSLIQALHQRLVDEDGSICVFDGAPQISAENARLSESGEGGLVREKI